MYEILMVNLEYGQLLNQFGDLSVEGEKRFNPQFASIEEVIEEKTDYKKNTFMPLSLSKGLVSAKNMMSITIMN